MAVDALTVALGEVSTPRPGYRAASAFVGRDESALLRAAGPDYFAWLDHVRPAAGCAHPIRLTGDIATVEPATGRLLSSVATADLPDGQIYKPCGNRRASVCPSCARTYQGDAYQLIRAGMVGGKGVTNEVAAHPAVFVTLTAPSFGPVHARIVKRHTCGNRKRCDCRSEPCHARRNADFCPHDRMAVCWARHEENDPRLGTPLCPDCYDYRHHVIWNNRAPELWRRTSIAIDRQIRKASRTVGVPGKYVRLRYAKVAEMQRRGVMHFHIVIRLDGYHPDHPDTVLPPPAGLGVEDLDHAVTTAAAATSLTTGGHPTNPAGWHIAWGDENRGHYADVQRIQAGDGEHMTDGRAAGYLAKYATKSTEATGHLSGRLDHEVIDLYADANGTHAERLIDACWTLGAHRDWQALRRWAHMLGFGGHFLTKARRYSVTFQILRDRRIIWRRTEDGQLTADHDQETTLVIATLAYTGSGWRTTGDALLANTAATLARQRQQTAREEYAAA